MKATEPHPASERVVRKWVREPYPNHWMDHHTLAISKRYPSMRGKRVEIYYDRHSLRNAIEAASNRRVNEWLVTNHLSLKKFQQKALQAWEEMDRTFALFHPEADFRADQVLVDHIDAQGKLHLILVDV